MWFQKKFNRFANIYKNEHNSMSHCFSNDQYIILESHAWIKDSFRIPESAEDFNMRKFEKK